MKLDIFDYQIWPEDNKRVDVNIINDIFNLETLEEGNLGPWEHR